MQPQHGMGYPGRAPQNATVPPYAPKNNYQPALVSGFSTGLCDCFSDTSLCCLTCCCPCITFGRIAEIVDKGSSSCGVSGALYSVLMCFTRFQWLYSCTYRSKMKAQFGIPEDNIADCCTHFCCEPCALCQEYRELQYRGYDVTLGWQGNMERANQEMVRPSMPGGMVR